MKLFEHHWIKSGEHTTPVKIAVKRFVDVGFTSLLLLAGIATQSTLAAFTVENSTIHFPEDGWYQVQSTDDFQSICNGLLACEVEPGTYIVINHTTGERFESVQISDVSGDTQQLDVSGNQISWPDNGWYQVQDASSYESLCEGGRQCTVPDGTYIVINHTTGERFEPVIVPSNGNPVSVPVSVAGNQIRWPEDGWYQVQNAATLESLCEGELSCTVPPGEYIVINHSTGMRYEGIVVDAIEPGGALINDSNYLGVLRNTIAILNVETLQDNQLLADELAVDLTQMGNLVLEGGAPESGLQIVMQTQDSSTLTIQDYACADGGTLGLPLHDFGFAPVTRREFAFDQCVYNGTQYSGGYSFTRSRRSPAISTFNDFSMLESNGNRISINGIRDDSTGANPAGIELLDWIDTTYIRETDEGLISVSGLNWSREAYETPISTLNISGYVQLQDGSTGYARIVSQSASLDSSFHLSAEWTMQQDVRVESNLGFDATYFEWSSFAPDADVQVPDYEVSELGSPLTLYTTPDFNPDNAFPVENLPRRSVQWETGEIRLIAFDGSTLVMQPANDRERVDIFLNGSSEAMGDNWDNGLQISCPDTFFDECR